MKPYTHILLLVFGFALLCVSLAAEAQPTVTFNLDVSDLLAAEVDQNTAEITITRSDDGNTAASLDVYVLIGGMAALNADYTASNLGWGGVDCCTYFIRIPADQQTQTVLLTPDQDNMIEGDENITFTLLDPQDPNSDYTVGSPSVAVVIILDFQDVIFRDSFE
jgi:hypothetical protein